MKIEFISKVHGAHIVIIDAKDYHYINEYNWYLAKGKKTFYLHAAVQKKKIKTTYTFHRMIMKAPIGIFVDHKDSNGLNNRRKNLRFATVTQNNWNKTIHASNKSGYKGVYFREHTQRYVVKIFKDGKQVHGGYFCDKIEAAKRYNELAIKLFGEYAKINIV